jgi:hypothetical protein
MTEQCVFNLLLLRVRDAFNSILDFLDKVFIEPYTKVSLNANDDEN